MKRGSINHDVRINNGKVITNVIFHSEAMTKQELAARVGMSLPTVTTILNRLQECGLITQGTKQQSTGGRPAQRIMPVYSAAYSVGVYVSPNHVRFCQTDLAPQITAKAKYELAMENSLEYWQQVRVLFERFKKEHGVEEEKLLGLGFALNMASQSLLHSADEEAVVISGDKLVRMTLSYIHEAFEGCEIAIRNDAKMAALAQGWSNPNLRDYIYLSMNNNIAGAIVSDKEIVGFERRNAEFGHMIIQPGGNSCACGMKGCFDAYCSASALKYISGLSLEDFFERHEAGDETVRKLWDEYLDRFIIAINNLQVVFDTDIIIGGIMSQYLLNFKDELIRRHQALSKYYEGEYSDKFLTISDLGEYGSAMGAGLVFSDAYLSNIFI